MSEREIGNVSGSFIDANSVLPSLPAAVTKQSAVSKATTQANSKGA